MDTSSWTTIGNAAGLQFFVFKPQLLRQHHVTNREIACRDDTEALDDVTIVVQFVDVISDVGVINAITHASIAATYDEPTVLIELAYLIWRHTRAQQFNAALFRLNPSIEIVSSAIHVHSIIA
jgi:hypothetical protein